MKNWYSIKAAANDAAVAEIDIFNEIGMWGVSAAQFNRDLKALGDVKSIILNVNSPGGSVTDGLAIYNLLAQHKAQVTARIQGCAASMASVVVCAADRVEMPDNTFLMIHDPRGYVEATADEMRDWADLLDKMKASLLSAYQRKTGLDEETLSKMMEDTTWLSASEAVDLGFADVVLDPIKVAAISDIRSRFEDAPDALTDPIQPAEDEEKIEDQSEPDPDQGDAIAQAAEIADLCAKADLQDMAASLIRAKATIETVKAKIEATIIIKDLCARAKMPGRAKDFIAAGASLTDVRAALFEAVIQQQSSEIQNVLPPDAITRTDHGWGKAVAKVNRS